MRDRVPQDIEAFAFALLGHGIPSWSIKGLQISRDFIIPMQTTFVGVNSTAAPVKWTVLLLFLREGVLDGGFVGHARLHRLRRALGHCPA